jgi:hypothetical protein
MEPRLFDTNDRFDRLQQLLLRMNVGQKLRPDEAAQQTGLAEATCLAVLRGLERAGLMRSGQDDAFVRCKLD